MRTLARRFARKAGDFLANQTRDSLALCLILRRVKARGNWLERGGADSRDPYFIYNIQWLIAGVGDSLSGFSQSRKGCRWDPKTHTKRDWPAATPPPSLN